MKSFQLLTTFVVLATANALDIAAYSDTHCSITVSSLVNTTEQCVTSPSGFSSLEIYSVPSDGTVTLFAGDSCSGENQTISLLYRGCMNLNGFVAKSIDFCE